MPATKLILRLTTAFALQVLGAMATPADTALLVQVALPVEAPSLSAPLA